MHEATLIRALIRQVTELAERQGPGRLRRIVIRVGALSHGQPEHLVWHFNQQRPGTIMEGATLEVIATDELAEVILESFDLDHAPGGPSPVAGQN